MRKTILLSALTVLTFSSCKKEVVGAKGDQGAQGIQGVQGAQGVKGQNGNANVIGSNEVTISSWTQNSISWTANLTMGAITQDVVNTGTVKVFIKYGSEWWALPDISGKNSTQYGFGVGSVTLYNSNSDGTLPSNPSSKTFRIVVIPSSGLAKHPDTDWNNYKEVSELL
jgi:hypothetical protein